MVNGGQIQNSAAATAAGRSPIVRLPTRQTTSAATAVSAIGTILSATQLVPKTRKSGTVSIASWEPP